MNEKIKELIKQAGFSDDFIDDPELSYIQQKFAELIIRECISIIEPTSHHKAYPYNYLGEAEGLELLEKQVYYIKKHFGIE